LHELAKDRLARNDAAPMSGAVSAADETVAPEDIVITLSRVCGLAVAEITRLRAWVAALELESVAETAAEPRGKTVTEAAPGSLPGPAGGAEVESPPA
jgi:hypothetical protein